MFKSGDICYIVENNMAVKQAKVINRQGKFYTVQLVGSCGAIRLKEHRLFATEEEAENSIPGRVVKPPEQEKESKYKYVDVFAGKRTNRNPHSTH